MNRRSFIKKLGLLGLVPFIPKVFFEPKNKESRDFEIEETCSMYDILPHKAYPTFGQVTKIINGRKVTIPVLTSEYKAVWLVRY